MGVFWYVKSHTHTHTHTRGGSNRWFNGWSKSTDLLLL